MQATGTFSGSGISKRAAAIVAVVLAAFVLGGVGVLVANGATSGQANPHVNAAPAFVPSSIQGSDSYRAIRGGLQLGDAAQAPTVQASSGMCTWVNFYKTCGSPIGSASGTLTSSNPAAADECIWVNRHKAC